MQVVQKHSSKSHKANKTSIFYHLYTYTIIRLVVAYALGIYEENVCCWKVEGTGNTHTFISWIVCREGTQYVVVSGPLD